MDSFTLMVVTPLVVFLVGYGAIVLWTAAGRLGWLPGGAAKLAGKICLPLERVRLLGSVVRGVRRRPISVGFLVSLAGALAVPWLVLAALLLEALATAGMVIGLVFLGGFGEDEAEEEQQEFHDYLAANHPFHPYGPANDIRSYDEDFMAGYGKLSRF